MSVVLHEVSHGYMAAILGDPTAKYSGRLTLNPFKHLDFVGSFIIPVITYTLGGVAFGWAKPVPYNPYNLRGGKWGPAMVAIAGPLANLFLAIVLSFVLQSPLFAFIQAPGVGALIIGAISINVVLFVINMIPVPPIDGSKVLFSLIPYKYNHVIEFMEKYQLMLILFVIFFLQIIISPFIYILFKLLIPGL
jgi:Zn-dependent protease